MDIQLLRLSLSPHIEKERLTVKLAKENNFISLHIVSRAEDTFSQKHFYFCLFSYIKKKLLHILAAVVWLGVPPLESASVLGRACVY